MSNITFNGVAAQEFMEFISLTKAKYDSAIGEKTDNTS